MIRNTLLICAIWALASIPFADTTPDGMAVTALPYPGAEITVTLANGDVIAFDGSAIDRYDAAGNLLANLGTLPAPTFPSFAVIAPDESSVVVGESSFGRLYVVALPGGSPTQLATLAFNYDAVFEDPAHVLVSAAPCFGTPGCLNEIHRVDVDTGAATLLVQVAGASGPVALNAAGDLFYGSVSELFPSPPGSSSLYRWPAASLTGTPVSDEADATLIASGFDGAASLAVDGATDEAYLAVNRFVMQTIKNDLWRISPTGVSSVVVAGTDGRWISGLEFVDGDGKAAFKGFQPSTGGTLRYNSTDFALYDARTELTPRRPQATFSGPGTTGPGDVDLTVTEGPPSGFAFAFYGSLADYDPNELALFLPTISPCPLFTGLFPGEWQLDRTGVIVLDGAGVGGKTYPNASGVTNVVAAHGLLLDATFTVVGTTTAAFF